MLIDMEAYLEHHGVKGMKWGVYTKSDNVINSMRVGSRLAHKILKQIRKLYSPKNRPITTQEKVGKEKTKQLLFYIGTKTPQLPIGKITSPAFSIPDKKVK